MSYQDSLRPWVIYRHLPDFQRQLIDRFRRRTYAEDYLKVIQRLSPQAKFELVYEIDLKSVLDRGQPPAPTAI